jgi:hypothetical protein
VILGEASFCGPQKISDYSTSANVRQHPPTSISVNDLRQRELLGLMVANPLKIGYSFDLMSRSMLQIGEGLAALFDIKVSSARA